MVRKILYHKLYNSNSGAYDALLADVKHRGGIFWQDPFTELWTIELSDDAFERLPEVTQAALRELPNPPEYKLL